MLLSNPKDQKYGFEAYAQVFHASPTRFQTVFVKRSITINVGLHNLAAKHWCHCTGSTS